MGVDAPAQEAPMRTLKRFARDASAVTSIEYGLIAFGVVIAIGLVVNGLGSNLAATFVYVSNALGPQASN
jgi:pilus assembly protein Flp/PilA